MIENLARPFMWNVVGTQGNINFHARRHVLTQYLVNTPYRLTPELRLFKHVNHDDVAGLSITFITRRDQYINADPAILWFNPANAAVVEIPTHDFLGIVLQNFGDDGFNAPAVIGTTLAHQHHIAVKTATHLAMIQYVVFAALIVNQKAEAIRMALDAPFHQIHLVDQAKGTFARAQQLAVADHGNQTATQCFNIAFVVGQTQLFAQFGVCCGALAIFQVLQNKFPTGNGVFVFLSFPFKIRVSGFPSADRS